MNKLKVNSESSRVQHRIPKTLKGIYLVEIYLAICIYIYGSVTQISALSSILRDKLRSAVSRTALMIFFLFIYITTEINISHNLVIT